MLMWRMRMFGLKRGMKLKNKLRVMKKIIEKDVLEGIRVKGKGGGWRM